MTKTINISVSNDDLAKIDDYCMTHNLSRSKLFLQSALEKVEISNMISNLEIIASVLASSAVKNVLSDDDLKRLQSALTMVKGA